MLRVEYGRYGGPEVLRLIDVPSGPLGHDQIRVRVKAASVNPVDWKIRSGVLKMMTGKVFPRGMGQDFAGIVEAVGPGAKRFKTDDQVFGAMELKDAATFAETIVTGEKTATLKPASLSYEEAATLGTVAQTAWLALVDVGRLQARRRVFVNGCLGSVGRCAVQIAVSRGAEVSGTCGKDVLAEAEALGVRSPIDYRSFDHRRSRGGFDLILDTAGTLSVRQCSSMLRVGGTAMHINPTVPKMVRVALSQRNKLVFLKTSSELLEKVGDLAARGSLTVPIGKRVSLQDAIASVTELERKGTPKGKLVIVPT